MKRTKSIVLFAVITMLILAVPFTAQAKQSGYFVRNKTNKYVEYHLQNGKKVRKASFKKGKKTYKVVNGRVTKINGKDEGSLKTKYGNIIYIKNGKTYNGIKGKKLYVNGLANKKANGNIKVKNKVYLFRKGTLFTGLNKNKYYKNGLYQNTYTGTKRINKKKYFIVKGKLFNGFYNKRYYKNGRVDTKLNGFATINGLKYYFLKGVVTDPTVVHPLKILLVGNSYTYYNGYCQMLSKMIAKTKKTAIVVRATCGGLSLVELMDSSKISYAAFKNGKVIAEGSNKKLNEVINMDFDNLKRAGKWDYIISQNNCLTANVYEGDIKFHNAIKGCLKNSKRHVIHAMYYAASTSASRYNEHVKAAEACKCSIINSNSYYAGYKSYFGTKWVPDLTIQDKSYHPSGRGGYLLALTIYAKLFGINRLASCDTDKRFITLYNSEGGTTKEFAPNKYNSKNATEFAMSVDINEAKKLQTFVRLYAEEYLGDPLYIQDYVV